jgi:hypothetical protein
MKPIVLDLDGTLIKNDTLSDAFVYMVSFRPQAAFYAIVTLITQGKASMKRFVFAKARSLGFQGSNVINQRVANFAIERNGQGHPIFIASGSPEAHELDLKRDFPYVSEIFATTGDVNLIGRNKAKFLKERFRGTGFIYAGNSRKDIPAWDAADSVVLVNTPNGVKRKIDKSKILAEFDREK